MTCHLMFHGLGTPPPHSHAGETRYWLQVDKFAEILSLAQRYGAQISIDDANDTDISLALPYLKNAGLTATFFIPTNRVGLRGFLSRDDILALRDAGMKIGSHGCAHIEWTKVSNAEIIDDVSRSIDILSALVKEKIDSVAVPFGECDLRVMRVLRRLNVDRVFTSFRGRITPNAWIVRRTCITTDMSLAEIEAILSRTYTAVDDALAFLRAWKHVGRAALWSRPSASRARGVRLSPISPALRTPGV